MENQFLMIPIQYSWQSHLMSPYAKKTKRSQFFDTNLDTKVNIYKNLTIGFIFDCSFFMIYSVAKSNLDLVQNVQNMSNKCIFKLNWDSFTQDWYFIFNVQNMSHVGACYLIKAIRFYNQYFFCLIQEYFRLSCSVIYVVFSFYWLSVIATFSLLEWV